MKNTGTAILATWTFALDDTAKDAVRLLERVEPKAFDESTQVMRTCQRVKSCSAACEHVETFVFTIQSMAICLLGGNAKDAGAFTVERLAGTAKCVGFVQMPHEKTPRCLVAGRSKQ